MPDLLERLTEALAERYAVEREIGRGGMATVFLAEDLKHHRKVAIKVLHPELASSVGPDRFLREVETVAGLTHPHVLPLFDSGEAEGLLFYTMPHVDGESLRQRLERESQLSVEAATQIALEVADALDHAHANSVIHRDIKPGNIMLQEGHALVTDFGVARAINEAGREKATATGLSVGTPAYMSPEQASGEPVDRRSDVYSLGCVLYEMLAGAPPFTGSTARAVLTQQMVGTPPSLEGARTDVPRHFAPTIRRALAKDPDDRFDNAADLAAALTGHVLPFGPAWRRRRNRRVLAIVATIVAVAAAGWLALRVPSAEALDTNRILVFPLADYGLPQESAGAGMDAALLIITLLEHAPPLKWDDGWRWMLPEHRSDPALMTADSARDIATSLRARFFLEGEFLSRADSVTVLLRLHDVAGDSVYARRMAAGPLNEVAYAQLTRRALIDLLPSLIEPGRPTPDLSAVTDREPQAVTAFLQGERAYRLARYNEAQSHYAAAVEQDSVFAYAAIKGVLAARWTHDTLSVGGFLDVASEHVNLLPLRYASFNKGILAYTEGYADSAVVALETVLEQSPDWPEAHTALGETYYHLLPGGIGYDEARPQAYFEAAIAADSGFMPPLFHLAEIAIRKGDLVGADAIVRRYAAADPEYGLGRLDLMLRCVMGGPESVDWEKEAQDQWVEVFGVANSMSVGLANMDCASSALNTIIENPRPEERDINWGTFLMYHNLLFATADYESLQTAFEEVEGPAANGVPWLYVMDAIAGAPSPFPDSAASLEGWLRQEFGERYETIRGPQTLWAAAIWNAHVGDSTRLEFARRALEEVAREPNDSMWRRRGVRFEIVAAADLARLRGDTALALDRYAAIPADAPFGDLAWEVSDPLATTHLRHAELLLAAGRNEEAIAVASIFDSPAAVLYRAFVPASLAVRYAAARDEGLSRQAAEYGERLRTLGRTDLIR